MTLSHAAVHCPRRVAVAPGQVDVWRIALDDRDRCEDIAILSPEERARAQRFRFPADRRRFVARRAALRGLLARRLGVGASDVVVVHGEHGKPMLDPGRHGSGLRFSASHSGDLAVVAMSALEVGVDVERLRLFPGADDIVARYFSPDERRAFEAIPGPERPRAFLGAWTLKEAYLKAVGDGLGRGLGRFTVTVAPGDGPRLLGDLDRHPGAAPCALYRFEPAPGYLGALALEP
jgi:4'-phosphopantetheinyl transferase